MKQMLRKSWPEPTWRTPEAARPAMRPVSLQRPRRLGRTEVPQIPVQQRRGPMDIIPPRWKSMARGLVMAMSAQDGGPLSGQVVVALSNVEKHHDRPESPSPDWVPP